MESQQKKLIYGIIAVIVVVAIGGYFYNAQQNASTGPGSPNQAAVDSNTNAVVNANNHRNRTTDAEEAGIVYQAALTKYKGKVIQFTNCQAYPGQMTFKSSTRIMLDSTSPDPQTIVVGKSSFSFDGYDFSTMVLPKVTTPTTILVDCKSGGTTQYSVAKIVVQP